MIHQKWGLRPPIGRAVIGAFCILIAGIGLSGSVLAAPEGGEEEIQSAWGPIPAESDSVRTVIEDRGIAAWEYPLVIPYRVITTPVGLVFKGVLVSGYTLSKQPFFKTISDFKFGFTGPGGSQILTNFAAGGALGAGMGLTVKHTGVFTEGSEFKVRGQTTTNKVHRATLGWRTDPAHVNGWDLGVGWRRRPNARYFGLGEYSLEADESLFEQEMFWAGLEHRWGLASNTALTISGLYSSLSNARATVETDRFPDLSEQFADNLPWGYGESSDGWSLGLALTHDTTTGDGRPEAGGFRRLKAEYFTATDGSSAAHWTYRMDLQQFLPLWHTRRALALRGVVIVQDNESSDPIHFQRLVTNDDPDLLRGYPDLRWHDEGLAVVSAEYRWPMWAWQKATSTGLDLYVFTDIGQVFDEFADISRNSLTESYGGGIRLINKEGNFAARIELAHSDEGMQIRVRGDQVFQYFKGGLFHGRDQIPSR